MAEDLSILVIETDKDIYVSTTDNYNSARNYLFNKEIPEATYQQCWFKIKQVPTEIHKKILGQKINIRYKLKTGFQPSELLTEITTIRPDEQIYGLYEYLYDTAPDELQEVPFKIVQVIKKDNYEFVKKEFNVQNFTLDKIQYHENFKELLPCYINQSDLFLIIKNHIKNNIDLTVARIYCDYSSEISVNWCTSIEPYTRTLESKKGRRTITRAETVKSRDIRCVTILEKSLPLIQGKDFNDLKSKVTEYLNAIINKINIHTEECNCCKGYGIIFKDNERKLIND